MDVILKTRRLTLRQPKLSDAERLALYLNNFGVAGNLSRVPYPYRLADAKAWLRTWRPDRPAAETGFTIDLEGEGLIGHVGFHTDEQGTVIGYWLGEPYWGQGYMSEAAGALVRAAQATGQFPRIRAHTLATNAASRRILEKIGFACLRERLETQGGHAGEMVADFVLEARP